jgi:hypothetical protein
MGAGEKVAAKVLVARQRQENFSLLWVHLVQEKQRC